MSAHTPSGPLGIASPTTAANVSNRSTGENNAQSVAVGARVRVTFPGNDWHDPETIDGTVTDRDDDSLEITPDGATIGEDFTLYLPELAAGRATLEVL